MKALKYGVLGLIALVLLVIASANRAAVEVRLVPQEMGPIAGADWRIDVPLFLVIFAVLLLGIGIGFVLEWLREGQIRSEAGQHRRRAGQLEREVSQLRADKGAPRDEVLALLDGR